MEFQYYLQNLVDENGLALMAEADYTVNRMAMTEEGSQCEEALFLQTANAYTYKILPTLASTHSPLFRAE